MANNNNCDGWGKVGENGPEEIVNGWGNVGENNEWGNATQWEHAGNLDNFVVVNNGAQKGKGVSCSSSKERPRNGTMGWKGKRDFKNGNRDFRNGNGGGGWKGKRAENNETGGWKGKRAASNEIEGWKGKKAATNENGGWKGKRAASNEIGGWKGKRAASNEISGWRGKRAKSNEIGGWSGKRASSHGNGGSQVSNGGYRVGKVQTLGNNFHGFNGHRVSLHFPVQSPHLQKILREDFALPDPAIGFQGQNDDRHPRPRQVNGPPPRQVNGPPPPPTPPVVNAVQVYQRPVEEKILSRKVRVTHSTNGGWVMEVEEYH